MSASQSPDRRVVLAGLALLATPLRAARLPAVTASPVRWAGAGGRTLHGYMAIPAKARGRQPGVLVIGEAMALPPIADPVARTVVEQLAAAGLLACTADNIIGLADLRASLAWLRFNRYATGKVALVAIGTGARVAAQLLAAEGDTVSAALLLDDTATISPTIPTLALPWRSDDQALPAGAAVFLKEHLR